MNNDRSTTITNSQLKEGYKQTEVGIIPQDWLVTALGALGNFKNGINKNSEAFGHGYPFVNLMDVFGVSSISATNLSDLIETNSIERQTYNLKEGDVLFIRSSVKPSGVGLTALIEEDLDQIVYSGFLIRFRDNGSIGKNFKQHCFYEEGFRKRLISASSVSANTNINQDNLKQLLIPLPPTKAEQEAIACTLSDIDALIESLDRLLTKKRQIKQGAMQDLLTGRERLLTFSKKWEEKYLGDIAEIVMGQSPKSSCYNSKGIGLPLIQGNADILNRQTIKRIFTTEVTKRGKYGDIIMSVRAPVGEIARAVFDSCLGRGVCAIRYDNDFLYHYLIWRESDWVGLSKGSTFDSVNSTDIRSFKLFIPNEPQEQIEIANILSDMDAEIGSIESKLTKTRQLKQGMMHELLTGRIRLVNLQI
jgi:type I restriction enzyme, S subunit